MPTSNIQDLKTGAIPLPALLIDSFLRDKTFIFAVALAGVLVVVSWLVFNGSGHRSASNGSRARSKNGAGSVILVGPSDGGKTSIFAQLIYRSTPQTLPSSVPSTSPLNIPNNDTLSTTQLTDLPGHPRLRENYKSYLKEEGLRGVVFVVDVGGLIRGGSGIASGVAEDLLPIMSSLASRSLSSPEADLDTLPKFLILANKADTIRSTTTTSTTTKSNPSSTPIIIDEKSLSSTIERAKTVLTREMSKLKSARATPRGKIEGMGAVSSSSSTSNAGILGMIRNLLGMGNSAVLPSRAAGMTEEDEEKEEDAEQMIWGKDPTGSFKWEEVDGVDVEWGASWVVPSERDEAVDVEYESQEDGLRQLRRWLGGL